MFGLTYPDLAALVIYLVGITWLGLRMHRRVRTTSDFFIGNRGFGKLLMIFYGFGTGTHPDQAVSVVAKTYTSGMSGIWYQWLWLPITPFNWWIGPIFRRARAITNADFFAARYDRSVASLYAVVAVLWTMVTLGLLLKGAGAVLVPAIGITDPAQAVVAEYWAIAVITAVFVAYGVAGGLVAAVMTDFIQGQLTIVLSFLLLPFALHAVGGFSGLHRTLPPETFALVAPGEIGLFYIVVLVVNGLVGAGTQPHAMACYGAGKSEVEAQLQGVVGYMIKRVCTVAWTLVGLCAIALYPGMTDHASIDQTFGRIARDLLPGIAPGLLGIFLASLFASVMAACSSFMLAASALFTQNIYKPLRETGSPTFMAAGVLCLLAAGVAATVMGAQGAAMPTGLAGVGLILATIATTVTRRGPHRSLPDPHYVLIGRAASVLVVASGLVYALCLESVVKGLEVFFQITAMMGVAFWAGLFWRRATSAGAWASTLTAFAAWYLAAHPAFASWAARHAPFLLSPIDPKAVYLPWQMVFYLSVSLAAMVVVSLLTSPKPAAELDPFFACFRTPIQPGEVVQTPCRLPPGVEPAPQRKLIDHPDWEMQRPTAWGIGGFLATWVLVILLVVAVVLIIRIGA